jgi:hypothetical protein
LDGTSSKTQAWINSNNPTVKIASARANGQLWGICGAKILNVPHVMIKATPTAVRNSANTLT